ncbi:hypothetical protein EDB85DRAFT_2143886 [Lactarius pseudohatsudake]|nr:hypothetical protein EDB85DRAFT_2143886 [Lactarius pseudohatsudake]
MSYLLRLYPLPLDLHPPNCCVVQLVPRVLTAKDFALASRASAHPLTIAAQLIARTLTVHGCVSAFPATSTNRTMPTDPAVSERRRRQPDPPISSRAKAADAIAMPQKSTIRTSQGHNSKAKASLKTASVRATTRAYVNLDASSHHHHLASTTIPTAAISISNREDHAGTAIFTPEGLLGSEHFSTYYYSITYVVDYGQ